MNRFKIILLIILFVGLISSQAGAFELDMSADEDIRKNYNPSKLEQDVLPGLPETLKNNNQPVLNTTGGQIYSSKQKQSDVPSGNISTEPINIINKVESSSKALAGGDSYTEIKVPRGTKFKVRSKTNLSDKNSVGAGMTFVSAIPVTKRYVSFPAGTTFKGYIEDVHQPNFAGNGGLLKLKINSMSYNGGAHNIDAKVVRANNKIIFLNNIKGKRGYLKGIAANVNKGEKFYQKTRNMSAKMSSNPIGAIVSPVPTVVGIAGYGVNLIASPLTALWSRGSNISLPAGTDYTIKFKQDLLLYK